MNTTVVLTESEMMNITGSNDGIITAASALAGAIVGLAAAELGAGVVACAVIGWATYEVLSHPEETVDFTIGAIQSAATATNWDGTPADYSGWY